MIGRAALVVLVALAGCAGSSTLTCDTGAICPEGYRCVTGEAACVLANCGNGRVDPGEACDDGNNLSGDGCPIDCAPPCGDGVLDPGEVCDDGNVMGGDGCAADCSSAEVCGNAVLDPGEACDDGDLRDHDGCSRRCAVEVARWSAMVTVPSLAPPVGVELLAYDPAREVVVALAQSDDLPGTTWEWDGQAWHERLPAHAPPVRFARALVYDGAGVVAFGGFADDQVWRWDGHDWTEQHARAMPPPVFGYAVTYDPLHHRVVLFGGNRELHDDLDQTWAWDGAGWTQLVTAGGPSGRFFHALAFDAARGTIVMFGGITEDSATSSETWELDGTSWRRAASAAPPARYRHGMAFDAARGQIVMFGGIDERFQGLDDTWAWDGLQWQAQHPAPTPVARTALLDDTWWWDGASWVPLPVAVDAPAVPRTGIAMASDGVSLVGFGGTGADGVVVQDTLRLFAQRWLSDGGLLVKPPARTRAAMAYDAARTQALLFGGTSDGSHSFSDTWAWRGDGWTRLTAAHVPPPRNGHAMVDAGMRVMMFGGLGSGRLLDDLWIWDGVDWTTQPAVTRPPARQDFGMAYDAARGRLVVFGGADRTGVLGDTWEWGGAGADWQHVAPATVPPARRSHMMAYDPGRGRVVMFGGADARGVRDDVWEWDGVDWRAIAYDAVPRPRRHPAMAYDAARGEAVMFGGVDDTGQRRLDDTWIWDGVGWRARTVATAPPARTAHAVVYDAARGESVLFGGADGAALDDTWLWDGATWRAAVAVVHPTARTGHAMVYDAGRRVVVLLGGVANGAIAADQWQWDGAAWTERTPVSAPPPRHGAALAYDVARDRVVLFGGRDDQGLREDVWEWDGATWRERTPPAGFAPAAREGHAMVYDPRRRRVVVLAGRGDAGELD
ncbi:MAG: kelch repeat-containing protein, partial [Kofleriaceae bacterium]